jgi:hypothetical protein
VEIEASSFLKLYSVFSKCSNRDEMRERNAEASFLECVQIVSGHLRQYGGKEPQTEVCMAE